jgi:uncharacterized membrane protein YbhN (UPF0104 family)
MNLLKLCGVALFVWILLRIDRVALLGILKEADAGLLLLSFVLLLGSYVMKTLRWHVLVKAGGIHPSFYESWKLYTLGIFFGNLTPGNLGELGRVPYLTSKGMQTITATALIALDRLLDVAVMGLMALVSIFILFGGSTLLWVGFAAVILITLLFVLKKNAVSKMLQEMGFASHLLSVRTLLILTFLSIAIWITYFLWTLLLAYGLGITLSPLILIAAITLTGMVSLLPIAPAGLGTRDAALVSFLSPYGIPAHEAVAMSLLMFTFIMLSCGPGVWYWISAKSETRNPKSDPSI